MSPHAARNAPALDHLVIATRDLDGCARGLEALGFAPTPEGGHPSLGTRNRTVLFPGHYLEWLRLEAPPPPGSDDFRAVLAAGTGVVGFALRPDDRPGGAGAPLTVERPVAAPGGTGVARFELAFLPPPPRRAAFLFTCHHLTPELVWRPDFLRHPNGAGGVTTVHGAFADPDGERRAYRELFGLPPDGRDPRLGPTRLVFGAAGPLGDGWFRVALDVPSPSAVRLRATAAGFTAEAGAGDTILLKTRDVLGVELLLESAAA